MKKLFSAVVLVCTLCLLLNGCKLAEFLDSFYTDSYYAEFNQNRPTNGSEFPQLDGEISDIRIQVQGREYSTYGADEAYIWDNVDLLQIYYGFQKNGEWYDYPSENYDIVSIFNAYDYETKEEKIRYGYEAADGHHIVKIGDYVLISIRLTVSVDEVGEVIIYDSANSQFQLRFSEYHSYNGSFSDRSSSEQRYGYLAEDIDRKTHKLKDCLIADTFCMRYYCILKYETVLEDYELVFKLTEQSYEYRLDSEKIKQLLNNTD